MKNIITLFFIVCFFSCKNNKLGNTSSTTNKNVVSVTADTIRISIDETFLPGYNITAYNKSLNYFYGYNHLLHQADYFNLDKKNSSASSIKLKAEGPNGVNPPNDLLVNDSEEIYLISNFDITKINKEGEVILKRGINSNSENDYYKDQFLFPSQDNGFEYNSLANKFYIFNTNMKFSKRKDIEKFFEASYLLGQYDFNEDKIELLPIKYPEEFTKKNFKYFICISIVSR